jgi:hypothetical protein
MTRKLSVFGFAAALCLAAVQAQAALVEVSQIGTAGQPTRLVSAAESGAASQPAPAGGGVYQFRVTTDGDILSVNNIQITLEGGATLFNNTFGDASNANPPAPGLEAAFPSILADSWITTPASTTSRLGPDLPGDGTTTFGDTVDSGPQNNFMFAQLTVPAGTVGRFTGRVSIAADGGASVFDQPFDLAIGEVIPEPGSALLASMSLLGFAALRRRMA